MRTQLSCATRRNDSKQIDVIQLRFWANSGRSWAELHHGLLAGRTGRQNKQERRREQWGGRVYRVRGEREVGGEKKNCPNVCVLMLLFGFY